MGKNATAACVVAEYGGDGQTGWYRRQHPVKPGAKRSFDEVRYTEQVDNTVGIGRRSLDHFQPWWLYKQSGLAVGEKIEDIEASWTFSIKNKTADCIWERNQWCVCCWVGVFKDGVKQDMQGYSTERAKAVESAEHLDELQLVGRKTIDDWWSNRRGANIDCDRNTMPRVDSNHAEHLEQTESSFSLAGAMSKEVDDMSRA